MANEPKEATEEMDGLVAGSQEGEVDDKGRLLIKSQLRSKLGTKVVLNLGELEQIEVYSPEKWAKEREMLDEMDDLNPWVRRYESIRFGMSSVVNIDPQGRLVIPNNLRQAAKIKSDVIIVSANRGLEIWAKEEREEFYGSFDYKADRTDQIYTILQRARGVA